MESTALNCYQYLNAAGNPLHSIRIHCSMLHGFHFIQPGYIAPCCMQSTAFTRDAFPNAAWNPVHSIMPHRIHCIQSVSIGPCCMESTAFNQDPLGQAACNPLQSLWMHFTLLNGIQCIQSYCMDPTAFNRYQLHQAALIHFIQSRYNAPLCIESTALKHAAWNPLNSIWFHWATLHGIHCIQSGTIGPRCMEPTAFHWDPLHHAAWNIPHSRRIHLPKFMESTTFTRDAFHITALNPLHSIGIYYPTPHAIHCIHSGCISHCFIESTALNLDAWIGINYTKLHGIRFIQWRYIAPL